MRDSFLPFSPPFIGDEEIAEVVDTLRSDWLSTGPKTKKFEELFSASFNTPAALALNSCTAGLHLALATLDLSPTDEVISTPMTFCSSVNVIEHVGARPVLADIEPDTLNISVREVERALTPQTRAVIAVHYAGHPVDLDPLLALTSARGIALIEDAAHAVGARYKQRWIGESDRPTAFSFYATKNLVTGEGGMLTGDPEFIDRARVLSLHGMNRDAWKRYEKSGSWFYEVVAPGFKYNMSDLQASLGLAQLNRLSWMQERRRAIANRYNDAFSSSEFFETPCTRNEVTHAWHLYVLRLNLEMLTISRDRFIEELRLRNIGTSVNFIPVHLHPYYRDKYHFKPEDFPVAHAAFQRILSIPLNPRLTDDDVTDVIDACYDVAKVFSR